MKSGFNLKKAHISDIPDICTIEKNSNQHPWKENYFVSELSNNISNFFVLKDKAGVTAGYIIFWIAGDESELHTITVKEGFRRKNLGSDMIDFLVYESKKQGAEKIFLEVRESNTGAINLYLKKGFREISRRSDYYSSPVEDCIVMKLGIKKN